MVYTKSQELIYLFRTQTVNELLGTASLRASAAEQPQPRLVLSLALTTC